MGKNQHSGVAALQKKLKPLASLKLAVFIIIAIGVMSAWGTIVEAMYMDADRAQDLVYHSWWSYSIFALLAINLIAVIFDRYPWKRHHVGFIAAHVGIIMLLAGSILTRYWGIDGSLTFDIGQKANHVSVKPIDLAVQGSLGTGGFANMFEEQVEFLKNPPTEKNPYKVPLGKHTLVIDKFYPYSFPDVKTVPSEFKNDGPGLRFQLQNERVSQAEWILMGTRKLRDIRMGLATIVMAKKGVYKHAGRSNTLLLEYQDNSNSIDYTIHYKKKDKKSKSGTIQAGDSIQTDWMGLTFRLLVFYPHAKELVNFVPQARKGEGSMSSIRATLNGNTAWIGLNQPTRFFTDDAVFIVRYGNRKIYLPFALQLMDFRVGRYQGRERQAMSYESDVRVIEPNSMSDKIKISMNEPLYYKRLTFYQSSFGSDKFGKPTTSILSVNYDPGRWWKYIGSLLIVFGAIHLFYFRGRKRRASK